MAVDLHTAQIQGFFDGPVDHLLALPMLADYVASQVRRPSKLAVVSPGRRPDQGGRAVVEPARRRAAGVHPQDAATSTGPTRSVANRVVGEVKGRICILVDDMIDTGGTISQGRRRADGRRRRRT